MFKTKVPYLCAGILKYELALSPAVSLTMKLSKYVNGRFKHFPMEHRLISQDCFNLILLFHNFMGIPIAMSSKEGKILHLRCQI